MVCLTTNNLEKQDVENDWSGLLTNNIEKNKTSKAIGPLS